MLHGPAMKQRYLVQILLPVRDNAGVPFPADVLAGIRQSLADRFGGVTAFTRAPAEGLWSPDGNATSRDDIVVVEVMVEDFDEGWWRGFQKMLEHDLQQDLLVIRASQVLLL